MESNQKDTVSHFTVLRQKWRKAVTFLLQVVVPGSRLGSDYGVIQSMADERGCKEPGHGLPVLLVGMGRGSRVLFQARETLGIKGRGDRCWCSPSLLLRRKTCIPLRVVSPHFRV